MPKKKRQLRAYIIIFDWLDDSDLEDIQSVIVFHYTSKLARVFGAKYIDWDQEDFCWNYVKCRRYSDADEYLLKGAEAPYLESDDDNLRRLGFAYERESQCEFCNLFQIPDPKDRWNDEKKKYKVCEECYQCTECGHAENCSNA